MSREEKCRCEKLNVLNEALWEEAQGGTFRTQ